MKRNTPSKFFYFLFGVTLFVFFGILIAILFMLRYNWSHQSLQLSSSPEQTIVTITITPISGNSASDSSILKLLNVSSSDEISAIEKDLEATDLKSLDEEVSSIELSLP